MALLLVHVFYPSGNRGLEPSPVAGRKRRSERGRLRIEVPFTFTRVRGLIEAPSIGFVEGSGLLFQKIFPDVPSLPWPNSRMWLHADVLLASANGSRVPTALSWRTYDRFGHQSADWAGSDFIGHRQRSRGALRRRGGTVRP